jgi:hypothetical protein
MDTKFSYSLELHCLEPKQLKIGFQISNQSPWFSIKNKSNFRSTIKVVKNILKLCELQSQSYFNMYPIGYIQHLLKIEITFWRCFQDSKDSR